MTPRAVLLAAVVAIAACASSGASKTEEARPTRPARSEPNVLTGEELAKTSAQDVYRALQIARPTWLRVRGPTSKTGGRVSGNREEVQVYVGAAHYGNVSTLQQLTVQSVAEVRYLDGRDATTRFGTGHGGGAIVVKLK